MDRRNGFLLAAYLFLVIGTTGFLQPFVPLYLQASGLDLKTIGLVMGLATGLALLIQPALGRLSDRLDVRRPFIFFCALAAGTAYLSFPYVHGNFGFFLLLAVGINGTTYLNAVGGVLIARMVKPGYGGSAYAALRMWGSVGYIVFALGFGLLITGGVSRHYHRLELDPIFHFGPILFFAASAIAWILPDRKSSGPISEKTEKAPMPEKLRRFLIAYFLYNFALYGSSNFISIYLKQLGASGIWISGVFAIGVVMEVLVMRRSGAWSDVYGRRPALALAFVLLPIRLLLYAPAPGPVWVAVVQSMHGFNFGIVGAVAVAFAMDLATEKTHGHAQARLAAVQGLATAVGPILFGLVSDKVGLRGMFCVSSGVAAIAAVLLVRGVEDSHSTSRSISDRAPSSLRPLLRWLDAPKH